MTASVRKVYKNSLTVVEWTWKSPSITWWLSHLRKNFELRILLNNVLLWLSRHTWMSPSWINLNFVRVSEQSSMAGALVHGRRRHCFKMTTRHHRFGHEQWPLLKTRGEIIGGDSETFFSPTRTIPIVNLYDTRKAIAVPIVEYNIYDNRICILNAKFSIALQSRDQWEWIMQTFRFKKGQKKK